MDFVFRRSLVFKLDPDPVYHGPDLQSYCHLVFLIMRLISPWVLSSPDFSEINEKFRAGPEDEGEEYEQEEDSKDLVRVRLFI
jgi:hypothetical protein